MRERKTSIRFGLAARIVAAGLAIVAAVHVIGAWHTFRVERSTLLSEIDVHGHAIAEAIAAAATDPIEHDDDLRLHAIVLQIMAVADHDAFVSISDASGNLLLVHPPSQAARFAAQSAEHRAWHRIYRGRIAHGSEALGEVAVGLPTHRAEALTAERMQPYILDGVLSLAATSGLLLVVLRHLLVAPLNRLRGAADAIAAGELEISLPVGRSDEIGALASAMERMRLALRAARRRTQRRTESLLESEQKQASLNAQLRTALDDRIRAADAAEAARERSERLSRTSGAFLARIGHSIRSPLATILGYLDLASDEIGHDEESGELLASIRRNAQGMLDVLGDALQLCALSSGVHPAQTRTCAPDRLVAEVADAARASLGSSARQFNLCFDASIPTRILLDESHAREALLRILRHVARNAGASEVRVDTRFFTNDLGPGILEIVVQHSGTQLERSIADQIVETAPERIDVPRDAEPMGLLVARFLAETAGGRFAIEQEPGCERCRLRIPAEPTDAPGPNGAGGSRANGSAGGRVLLVEDDPDDRRILVATLHKAGVEVECVDDGGTAVAAFERAQAESRRFDMILLDIRLPTIDGHEAARRIRDAGFEGPIFALTAYAAPGDRGRCLEAGCDDYLNKPIDVTRLVSLLRRPRPVIDLAPEG